MKDFDLRRTVRSRGYWTHCRSCRSAWISTLMMMVTLLAMIPVSPVVAAERVLSRRLVRPLRARRNDDARPRLGARLRRRSTSQSNWRSLFDGKTLGDWKKTEFGGEGDVGVSDGRIVLQFGYSMTGITYSAELPKMNYELQLEAVKLDGDDFFCGLTFPVADAYCSFIVGGWGGSVVGLSSIDGADASENDTTKYMNFKKGQWYRIRVRVEPERIQTWIDDRPVVNQNTKGKKISIRNEVDLSCPLGVSTWETKAALRKIQIRKLP